jgi:XTP/dITP diphosphohydrolase
VKPLRVVLATRNPGKTREFGRLLGPLMSVESLPGSVVMPDETGQTFTANARLKAESAAAALGGSVPVLADDSGLQVARLDGRPGVLSARFAGEGASDEENVAKLLGDLGDEPDRTARFVCCLCLVLSEALAERAGATVLEAEGVLEGQITWSARGDDGFGYDPIFLPAGWGLTLAQAEPSEKDGVSHRGAASRALVRQLLVLHLLGGKEI